MNKFYGFKKRVTVNGKTIQRTPTGFSVINSRGKQRYFYPQDEQYGAILQDYIKGMEGEK